MNTREMMEKLGVKLGDCVVGTCPEDGEVTVLKLLRFDGLGRLVAKNIRKNDEEWNGFECNWSLGMREWTKYGLATETDAGARAESNEEEANQPWNQSLKAEWPNP